MFRTYRDNSLWLVCFFGLVTSGNAQATIGVDRMFSYSNEKGNGIISVTNRSMTAPTYLKGEVIKLSTENGEIQKIPLTRENFPMWDLTVSPSLSVLNPGETKDYSIKYLCQQSSCPRDNDLAYQIRFLPVPPPNKVISGKTVKFRFGMAPVYIIPALKQQVDYTYDYNRKTQEITLNNTGNTFVKMEVDGCNKEKLKENKMCRGVYHILAGRKKVIKLPDDMVDNGARVKVANHDQSIEKSYNISGF